MAIEAIRAHGHRALVSRGWAGLGRGPDDDGPAAKAGSVSAALSTILTPQTRARAAAVAGAIRTDGAAVAAKLLLDMASRARPPVPA